MNCDVCVIVLAYNEENNIAAALEGIVGWPLQVFVLDSFSLDRTVEIARAFPCEVVQHAFEGYAKQRNWALEELPIECEWVLFVDADERIPAALRDEIIGRIRSNPTENGFCIGYSYIWMGERVAAYGNPTVTRLFRRRLAYCEARPINERMIVDGKIGVLHHRFIHDDQKPITAWVEKHIKYARLESEELCRGFDGTTYVPPRLWGSIPERRRWLRYRVYNRFPIVVRCFLLFVYHYVIRGGFMGGRSALIFYVLHSLWYPVLIDSLYLERKQGQAGLDCDKQPYRVRASSTPGSATVEGKG